jgi:dipeptidyl aminopeptidase/acylaminoacyl peptidase
MTSKKWFSVLFVAMVLTPALTAQGSHPFSVHDMLAMQRVSGHQVSPGGQEVVFVLRTTDLEANRGRSDLWLVGTDGTRLRRLTTHSASDFNPRWSADGKQIWFLSTRSGSAQIWKIPRDGGEAVQASDYSLPVGNLEISPDGSQFLFSLEVFPDCPDLGCSVSRLEEADSAKVSGRVYDRIFVRHWDSWKDGRRSHLFTTPTVGGKPKSLMVGMDADCPSKPFGGSEEFTFSPDGAGVVFAARNVETSEPWSTNFDLYYVPLDGSSAPRNLTESNLAWDTQPVFSPDGKTLAFLAMSRAGFEADRFRIMLRSWPDGPEKELAPGWDRSPSGVSWSPDGQLLFTTASNLGNSSLFSIHAQSGEVRTLVNEGSNSGPAVAGDRLVFSQDDLDSPDELYSSRWDGSDVQPITQVNKELLTRSRMGAFEQFTFKGWNNETVHAWVVKPVDFNSSVKYPVAFLIHGGPQGSFGNHFHYRWNPQAYAGAGYAVVMVDFHGSTGYGQQFTDSITQDWGGKPLEDLQKGLAAALERYSWLDQDRVGALGASYGGYMVNWIAGNWSDRFKCLVNHDGTFDNRMMYYVTEELWFPEWEHGGPYFRNPQGHEKHNPARFVENWKTPMLVIHGALDFRLPLEQGLATFTALQRRSVPSRFLYFPDENHWVLSPANSVQWHDEVLGWLHKWLK